MNGVIYVFHKSLVSPIPRVHGLSQVAALAGERPFTVVSFEGAWSRRSPGDRETYETVRGWLASQNVVLTGTLSVIATLSTGTVPLICQEIVYVTTSPAVTVIGAVLVIP